MSNIILKRTNLEIVNALYYSLLKESLIFLWCMVASCPTYLLCLKNIELSQNLKMPNTPVIKIQKMMSKFRTTAIFYVFLTLVFIFFAIVFIVKHNGSDQQNYFLSQGKNASDSGKPGRLSPPLASQDYFNKLCELDR